MWQRQAVEHLGFSILFILLAACAQAPTKTFTAEDIDTLFLQKSLRAPINLTAETVIVDARSAFDFAVAHLPNSVNIQWRDFSEAAGPASGLLKKDQTEAVRRLALLGITPKSQIVIVGDGPRGHGEEGRLAWTLTYLGFADVQTAQIDSLHLRYSNIEPPPRVNKPTWQPVIYSPLQVSLKEMKRAIEDGSAVVIDVRSPEEILATQVAINSRLKNFKPLAIDWREFFTAEGRPNFAIRKKLADLKVKTNDHIIAISNRGVRSGAVTYALLALGYKKAANESGGFEEVLSGSQ